MTGTLVTLAVGLESDGEWNQMARLRPLAGHDELFAGELGQLSPAARTSALLGRVLVAGPGLVAPDQVGALCVGDREALMLHLRRMLVGDRLSLVFVCPHEGCRQPMDLDLTTDQILGAEPATDRQTWHELTIVSDEGRGYQSRFRLPTGDDLEAIAEQARRDPEAAARDLLSRCVAWVKGPGGDDCPRAWWPASVADGIARAMTDRDVHAETLLALTCPCCERDFEATLDVSDVVLGELAARARAVFWQVHQLALRYHWSEAEILSLASTRRRLYLDLLEQAGSEGGLA